MAQLLLNKSYENLQIRLDDTLWINRQWSNIAKCYKSHKQRFNKSQAYPRGKWSQSRGIQGVLNLEYDFQNTSLTSLSTFFHFNHLEHLYSNCTYFWDILMLEHPIKFRLCNCWGGGFHTECSYETKTSSFICKWVEFDSGLIWDTPRETNTLPRIEKREFKYLAISRTGRWPQKRLDEQVYKIAWPILLRSLVECGGSKWIVVDPVHSPFTSIDVDSLCKLVGASSCLVGTPSACISAKTCRVQFEFCCGINWHFYFVLEVMPYLI